ncbi:MAG: diacylglycerol kinase [Sinobacterium sp.]|nr:diacylglycerol kinase [Sinobacterium sp.]
MQENNNKPGRTGISRIIWAGKYSYQGICAAWQNEAAFRQELVLMGLLLPSAFWLGQTAVERIALITPLFIVVIVELLNSAIEATVDRIGSEKHELSGRAKDMGSAAVLFALGSVIISWGCIAAQRFL